MDDANAIKAFIADKLYWLGALPPVVGRKQASDGERRAALARLRRGVGKDAGSVPEIWEYVYSGFPDTLKGDHAENAIHLALTLYAMHAQGASDEAAHSLDACSLGKAANNLKYKKPSSEAGIKRRFDSLATAKTPTAISAHSRGLIQLLRQNGVALDYVGFAADLYRLQTGHNSARRVLSEWGRDFHSSSNKNNDSSANDNVQEGNNA